MNPLTVIIPLVIVLGGVLTFFLVPLELWVRVVVLVSDIAAATGGCDPLAAGSGIGSIPCEQGGSSTNGRRPWSVWRKGKGWERTPTTSV